MAGTANFWSVDLAATVVFAYNKKSSAYVTVPVTSIPEINAICVALAAQQFELSDSEKLLGPSQRQKGPAYSYRLPVAPAPLVDTLVYKEGVKTNFHKAKVSGEICMSDFIATFVESVRPAFRWPGTLVSSKVWDAGFGALGTNGVGNIKFSQSTSDLWKVDAPLNKVRFMYRAYVQTSTDFSYAPPVSLQNWDDLILQSQIDVATVTSAVAAANSGYWDALTEFGEMHETVSFLKDSVKSVALSSKSLSDQIKSGIRTLKVNDDLPKRFSKKAQSAWLAYRYAVMPLFYSVRDIHDVTKAWLDRIYRDERSYMTEKVLVPEVENMSPSVTHIDIYHRCTIRDRYDASSFASKLNALISLNPVATAYELTRLSFVLDWFINLGDLIRATTSVHTESERKSCYSRKIGHVVVTYSPTSGNGPIVYVTCNTYKREVINPTDHIGLTSDVYLNWKRQIDAVALGISPSIKLLRSLK